MVTVIFDKILHIWFCKFKFDSAELGFPVLDPLGHRLRDEKEIECAVDYLKNAHLAISLRQECAHCDAIYPHI